MNKACVNNADKVINRLQKACGSTFIRNNLKATEENWQNTLLSQNPLATVLAIK